MRRDTRIKDKQNKLASDKIIMYAIVAVVVLAIILIGLLIYSKSLSDEVREGTMSLEQMANIAENNTENTQSASSEIGKTVEESKNEVNTINETKNTITTNNIEEKKNNTINNQKKEASTTNKTQSTNAETVKELNFELPVEGEVIRDYAKENLIYSETLKEWVTHMGIDIKADKTTVVKTAEEGVIKSIKNDPRYGLTIVVEHDNGFQTVYSNLLTSEFVVEGEKVQKGQSIGTVGNTAVFEIVDEPHLHFEILKDSIQVDPNIYLK